MTTTTTSHPTFTKLSYSIELRREDGSLFMARHLSAGTEPVTNEQLLAEARDSAKSLAETWPGYAVRILVHETVTTTREL